MINTQIAQELHSERPHKAKENRTQTQGANSSPRFRDRLQLRLATLLLVLGSWLTVQGKEVFARQLLDNVPTYDQPAEALGEFDHSPHIEMSRLRGWLSTARAAAAASNKKRELAFLERVILLTANTASEHTEAPENSTLAK